MSKPSVFKAAGAWVWLCIHTDEDGDTTPFSEVYTKCRDKWTAALTGAQLHSARVHAEGEDVEAQ